MPHPTLEAHLEWLGIERCVCPFEWKDSIGRLYGISMGSGWVRLSTNPDCEYHGDDSAKRESGS